MKLVIQGLSEGCILTVLSGIVSSIIVSIVEVKTFTFSSISSAAYTSDQSSSTTLQVEKLYLKTGLILVWNRLVVSLFVLVQGEGIGDQNAQVIGDQNAQVVADGASDCTCLAYSSGLGPRWYFH